MVNAYLSIALALALALIFEWRTAIGAFLASPVILLGAFGLSRLVWSGRGAREGAVMLTGNDPTKDFNKATAMLSDMIFNYKTVISFGDENVNALIDEYALLLIKPVNARIRNSHVAGIMFGYSQAARMIYAGVVFYIGGQMISRYEADSERVFLAIYVIFITGFGAGQSFSNIPSVSKAKEAAEFVFDVIDEKSTLDVRDATEKQIMKIEHGAITFNKVNFRYPSRDLKVLRNFTMEIPANGKIALVGHSGCGKSTITNLLLRFYEL